MKYGIQKAGSQSTVYLDDYIVAHCLGLCNEGGSPYRGSDGISDEKRARMVKFVHEWWDRIKRIAAATKAYNDHDYEALGMAMTSTCMFDELRAAIRQVEEGDKPERITVGSPPSWAVKGLEDLSHEVWNSQFTLTIDDARALRDEIDKQLGK